MLPRADNVPVKQFLVSSFQCQCSVKVSASAGLADGDGTQLVIAGNLGFLTSKSVAGLMDLSGEVSRLLDGLIS